MKFIYTGEYLGPTITIYGVTFEPRNPSEVTEEHAIRKFTNSIHFEAVEDAGKPKTSRKTKPDVENQK